MAESINQKIVHWIDKVFYKKYEDQWDNTFFREFILKYIKQEYTILDLGAGRGGMPQMNFRGTCKKVVGLDPTDVVMGNPFLDEAHVGLGDSMPFFENETFDLIFSNNVLEHVENPEQLFKEVNRILKPGGLYIAKTPNKYHYTMMIASVTPTWFHKFYNKARGRETFDTFPTFYHINSTRRFKEVANSSNMEIVEHQKLEGRPEYMRLTFITYLFGIVYERIVNTLNIRSLKVVNCIVFKKTK